MTPGAVGRRDGDGAAAESALPGPPGLPGLPALPAAAAAVRAEAERHRAVWGSTPYVPGHCNVCGADTVFFCAELARAREAMTCPECRSVSRYRSLARGVLRAAHEIAGVQAPDLASLTRVPLSRSLRVYDTQFAFDEGWRAYRLPSVLADAHWVEVQTSSYNAELPLGHVVGDNSTNQNLELLTFADATFDIVVSSELLHLVAEPPRAHAEVARVLRPRGVYVFTVPHTRVGSTHTPDGVGHRVYGVDLDEQLREAGFTVEYAARDHVELGIVNTELFYCRKG